MPAPAELARSFFDAYARGDREAAAALLADDLTAYVTNASGEADVVSGRDDYMARVPDLQGVPLRLGGTSPGKHQHRLGRHLRVPAGGLLAGLIHRTSFFRGAE